MKYCLIGNPIKHSLSPILQTELGRIAKTETEYFLEECEDINIEYLKENYDGFNVTMPFKEKITQYCDRVFQSASVTGSGNTVRNEKGILSLVSTDGDGFAKDFRRVFKTDFYNKNICILGTGGTAKSISYAIEKENPKNIFFLSRSRKGNNIFSYDNKEILRNCTVIINTTPVGMNDKKTLLREKDFPKNAFVYDVIYSRKTEFLKEAEKAEAKTADGFGMLVCQGILSMEYWQNIIFEEKETEHLFDRNFYIK